MIFKEEIKMEELRTEMNEMNFDGATDVIEECIEASSGGFKKVVVIGGGALMAGATALAIKNRDKIKAKFEERKISKLKKKGYVVTKSGETQEVDYSVETDEDDEN